MWTILGDAQKWFASELKSSNVSWLQCVLKYINLFHLENAERIIAFCAPPLASQCSSSLQFSYDQSLILWEWVHSKKSQDEELLSEILRKTDEGLCWDESWVNNGIKDKQLSIYFVHNPSFYLAKQIMTAINEQIIHWEETRLREYIPVFGKKWVIPLRQLGPGHLSHKTYQSPHSGSESPSGTRNRDKFKLKSAASSTNIHRKWKPSSSKVFNNLRVWGLNLSHNKCNQSVCCRWLWVTTIYFLLDVLFIICAGTWSHPQC